MDRRKRFWLTIGFAAATVVIILLLLHYCSREPQNIAGSSTETWSVSREAVAGFGTESPAEVNADRSMEAGQASISYSDQVPISKSDETAHLLFSNPADSASDMSLALWIDGACIGGSELLRPGDTVEMISAPGAVGLSAGIYEGSFVIDHYDASGSQSYFSLRIYVIVEIVD